MDLHKLTVAEIRNFDNARVSEVEKEVRHQMAMMGMDIYSADGQHTGKKRGLRKSLAKILTVKTQMSSKTSK